MAISPTSPPGCGSQFFITLADKIDYLDGKHAVFGHVIEGLDTLDRINEAFLDKEGRPLQDIRIRHVEILGESGQAGPLGRLILSWAYLPTEHPHLLGLITVQTTPQTISFLFPGLSYLAGSRSILHLPQGSRPLCHPTTKSPISSTYITMTTSP